MILHDNHVRQSHGAFVSNVKAGHAQCHLRFVFAVVPLPYALCGQVSHKGGL